MLLSFSPFSSSDFSQFKQINSRRTIDNIQLAVLNLLAVLARSAGAMMPFLCCELHRILYLQGQLFYASKAGSRANIYKWGFGNGIHRFVVVIHLRLFNLNPVA